MKTKDKVALILLPVGALFALHMNGVFDSAPEPPKSVPTEVAPARPQAHAKTTEGTPEEGKGFSKKEIVQEIANVQRRGWVRDPFTTPVEEGKITKIIKKAFEEPLPELNLELIFFNGNEYVATVSGKIIKKGDKIGIETLAQIGDDHIILRSQRGKRTLFLNQPDISFSVEETRNDEELND